MDDFWFVLYHAYTTSKQYDMKGLKHFEKDIKFAQEIGVKSIILEDYFDNFNWGEYTTFWNQRNFKEMIRISHDYGIKVIPYANATELSYNSNSFKTFGMEWGAKNRWGIVYSGFNSIFLPHYFPIPFFNKVMCPMSGWRNNLEKQVEVLFDNFEIDGIYFDRVDYRVKCYDHSKDLNHFRKGIPPLIESLSNIVKKVSRSNILVINDSCMKPDKTLIKCIRIADMVLSELLPMDWHPNSFYNKLNLHYGGVAWKLRRILIPLIHRITEKMFQSNSMINYKRISTIVERLSEYISPDKVILFSHRRDQTGYNAIKKVVKLTGAKIGYFMGLKQLLSLKKWKI